MCAPAKGRYNTVHKVAEDAVETARRFLNAGATLIHMVDLDAAKDGTHANYDVVERVIRETGATVELGGGIRTMADIENVLKLAYGVSSSARQRCAILPLWWRL